MFRVSLLVSLLAGPAAHAGGPSLAAGFSSLQVVDGPAPADQDAGPVAASPTATRSPDPVDRDALLEVRWDRYRRARRLHRAGLIATAGGVGAMGLGLAVIGVGGLESPLVFPGLYMVFGGVGLASFVGPVLANVGAIRVLLMADDVLALHSPGFQQRSPLLGVAGLGVLALGIYVAVPSDSPELSVVLGAATSVGLSVAQVAVANRPLRDRGLLAVVPTRNGLAIAGRF